MRNYNALYYFLFILLITGAFASMAQNSYGLKIMGGVAFAFSLAFIFQLVKVLRKPGKKDPLKITELICLFVLSLLFGFRVFYIHFPNIELVFGVACILLFLVFLRKMIQRFIQFREKNKFLAMLVLVFHLSILFFLLSLALIPFAPAFSNFAGAIAIILFLIFVVSGFMKRDLLVDGEKLSAFSMVRQFKDHSILIISMFVLISVYVGLSKAGVLPQVYADQFPRAYYDLVNNAATKNDKTINGRYKHEEFKFRYEELLKNVRKKN